jgi:hypothetical protein
MSMTPEQLAADRATCDAATPGPWECGQYRPGIVTTQYQIVGVRACDVPFIAAARTRWPAALDRIEQLERELLNARLAGVDLMNQCRQLREQVNGHAERIAAQSELLSRKAEK